MKKTLKYVVIDKNKYRLKSDDDSNANLQQLQDKIDNNSSLNPKETCILLQKCIDNISALICVLGSEACDEIIIKNLLIDCCISSGTINNITNCLICELFLNNLD